MATQCHVGVFDVLSTDVATTTIGVTDPGFTPKVLILWTQGRSDGSDAVGRASIHRSIGFVAGTGDRRCVVNMAEDAQANVDSNHAMYNDRIAGRISVTSAADGALDLASFDANGFTAVVDTQFGASMRFHYLALGGADITNVFLGSTSKPTATGDQAITGVGFQGDLVLFLGSGFDPENSIDTDCQVCIGAADGTNQAVLWGSSDDADSAGDSQTYCNDVNCLAAGGTNGNLDSRATFSSFDADGFTINWTAAGATTNPFAYLVIKGGRHRVGSFLTQTDTSTPITATGLSIGTPVGAMFFSGNAAEDAAGTQRNSERISIGAASSPSARGAQGSHDENGVLDTEIQTAIEHDAIYVNVDSAAAVQGLMDLTSFDSDGWSAIMDDADPSQAFGWFVAFGSAAVVSTPHLETWAPTLRPPLPPIIGMVPSGTIGIKTP